MMSPAIPRRYLILAVLAAVAFMAQLDFFIVNIALTGIGRSFHGARNAGLSWVLSAYAIVFAAGLVPAGRLADQRGLRRTLLLGVLIFTGASGLGALAPSLEVLVGARALQAVGAAMIVPTSLGLLYPSFPESEHTRVVGIWAAVAAIASASGPPLGGLLVGVDWRLIFLVNVPIGLSTVIFGRRVLPERREPPRGGAPEPLSVATLLGAVSLLVLGISEGTSWGWGSPRTLLVLALAVLFTFAALQRTLRAASPVIEPRLFRNATFTASSIAALLFFVGFAIYLLASALLMEQLWGFDAVRAGLGVVPSALMAMVFAVNAGRIRQRFGQRIPAIVGMSMMAAAAVYWLIAVGPRPDYWAAMFPGQLIMGVSGGLSQAPLFAAASRLEPERAATGSAVLQMARQIGSALGVAILIAFTSANRGIGGYADAWLVQTIGGATAASVLASLSLRRLGRRRGDRVPRARTAHPHKEHRHV